MRWKYPGSLFLATLLMLLPAHVDAQALQERRPILASPMTPAFDPQGVREDAATHIVRGTVLDITSFWENGAIHSLAKVHPEQWLKGQAIQDDLFLKYDGGRVGNIERAIDPGPRFFMGEKATVFVSHMGDNLFKAIWKENSEVSSLQGSTSSFEPGGQGYSYIGHYWSGQPKEFTPNFDRGTLQIAGDQEWSAVQAAIDTWNRAGSTLTFTLGQSADCNPGRGRFYENFLGRDFRQFSCIGWVHSSEMTVPGVIAQAERHYDLSGATIIQVDIRFNDSDYAWRLNPTLDHEADVQGIATHELGHAIELLDLEGGDDELQTMFESTTRQAFNVPLSKSTLLMRSLFWGDVAGIRYVYPRQYGVSPGQWIGDVTEGGDAVLANLGGDRYPELVFLWVDADPTGPNKIYYRIGWDVNLRSVGEVGIWMTGQVEKPGWVGDDTQGAGVAVA